MIPTIPAHYEIMTDEDKRGYQELQKSLQSVFALAPRSSKIGDSFECVVERLRNYVLCGDRLTELRRSLVCGILWMGDVIAINTRQLCTVIGKCKSSVNSGLQFIGYTTIPTDAQIAAELARAFPFMRTNFSEIRQWTFRLMPTRHRNTSMINKPPMLEDFTRLTPSNLEIALEPLDLCPPAYLPDATLDLGPPDLFGTAVLFQ